MELRKLPPRFRTKLSQLLDIDEGWKKLMSSIPSTVNASGQKYTSEHIQLVERHGLNSRKLCGEIFLDEWSTSGTVRPTAETLYELLQQCQLYRAADYVAEEILEVPLPSRPTDGPAKRISESLITQFEPEEEEEGVFPDARVTSSSALKIIPSTQTADDGSLQRLLDQLNNYDFVNGKLINFSINTIQTATKGFSETYKVGSGSFGTVYKLELGSIPLAIKLLHPTCTVIEEQFVTEINVLSRFRHENLVSLIGYCSNGPQFCLVYEFMAGGTLMEALAAEGNMVLPWSKRLPIMFGVIKGIHCLHNSLEKTIIHRDIKSANILLSRSHQPKIGDFGLAKSFSTTGAQTSALASTIFGTSAYMAPEAFRGDISPKMDVFSYGVILLEIITGLPPYDEEREGNDIVTYLEESVENDDISPWVDTTPGDLNPDCASTLYQIALRCLAEKKRRPTSEVVLNDYHTFMLNFTHYCGGYLVCVCVRTVEEKLTSTQAILK
ncbi:unnamed protein product [Allacma fusca]|uniref:non-specific serine/threonine protein kinase n=1 Tax=Allacma fusca TaxID=39272 RepID=A0A8J2NMD0_9HEXA|nr:unnamed protein product [Allacma fusca]